MTNPYQSPCGGTSKARPGSWTAAELAELKPLRGQILVLRIIVASLALGVLVFAGVAIVQNLGKPHVLAGTFEPLNLVMLALAVAAVPVGIVVPWALFRHLPLSPEAAAQFAASGPEVARVQAVQARLQMAAIFGCADFEAAAFANVFAYMVSAELLNLIVAAVMLLGILARFPLPGQYERWIEDELRRQDEEAALRVPR